MGLGGQARAKHSGPGTPPCFEGLPWALEQATSRRKNLGLI